MLSNRQMSLIDKQKEEEEASEGLLVSKTICRVGDRIEFESMPEFNGKVIKVTTDQWKMIVIDYGCPGHTKILAPFELTKLVVKGEAKVIPASKDEVAKQVQQEMAEKADNRKAKKVKKDKTAK